MTDLLTRLAMQDMAPQAGVCGDEWADRWPHLLPSGLTVWKHCACGNPAGHSGLHECSCGKFAPQHSGSVGCPRCEGGWWPADQPVGRYCGVPA